MIDWKGELFEWMPGCIGIFRHDGKCLRTVALNAKMRVRARKRHQTRFRK